MSQLSDFPEVPVSDQRDGVHRIKVLELWTLLRYSSGTVTAQGGVGHPDGLCVLGRRRS